jgi:hypothetical protein
MRKLSLIAALALSLIALPGVSAYADDDDGCRQTGQNTGDCGEKHKHKLTQAPEPTSFVLLATGLLVGGAVLVLRRKGLLQN